MGFKCMIEFGITKFPSRLAYWLVDNFNARKCKMKVCDKTMEITQENVHEILGFPMRSIQFCAAKRARI